MHTRRFCAVLVASFSLGVIWFGGPAMASNSGQPRASLQGASIPLREVGQHHCHNAKGLMISCFATSRARDRDLGRQRQAIAANSMSVAYVTVYEHSYYGGASLTIFDPISHLGTLGWNDAISSFKSLNGQRPKWWPDTFYAGLPWQWAAGAWVSYVGNAANDRFSSVKNVP